MKIEWTKITDKRPPDKALCVVSIQDCYFIGKFLEDGPDWERCDFSMITSAHDDDEYFVFKTEEEA